MVTRIISRDIQKSQLYQEVMIGTTKVNRDKQVEKQQADMKETLAAAIVSREWLMRIKTSNHWHNIRIEPLPHQK